MEFPLFVMLSVNHANDVPANKTALNNNVAHPNSNAHLVFNISRPPVSLARPPFCSHARPMYYRSKILRRLLRRTDVNIKTNRSVLRRVVVRIIEEIQRDLKRLRLLVACKFSDRNVHRRRFEKVR